jgi:hypothetical protein
VTPTEGPNAGVRGAIEVGDDEGGRGGGVGDDEGE